MSIENVVPEKNEIAFKWLNNYAGVTLKTPTETIVVDPVDVSAKAFPILDAILITHEHYDHLDGHLVRKIQERTNCRVLADPTSRRKLEHSIPSEKLQEMQPGTEIKVGNVTVRAEMCNHQPATTPITFLITSEENVTIFHTADSLPFPEMKDVSEKCRPDLAFCTVGIAPGASPKTGIEIAEIVRPEVAVPYHSASKISLIEFCKILKKKKLRTKCLIPERGNTYVVGKGRR